MSKRKADDAAQSGAKRQHSAAEDDPFQFDFKRGAAAAHSLAERERAYLSANAPAAPAAGPAFAAPKPKAKAGPARPAAAAAASTAARDHERPQSSAGDGAGGLTDAELEDVLALVDDAPDVKELDSAGLRQLLLRLDKAAAANIELRAKYADAAPRFMESELTLHDAIVALQPLANAPGLYAELLRSPVWQPALNLLAHENTDIAIAVVDLLHELVELDEEDESDAQRRGVALLTGALVSSGALALVANNLERFDDAQPEDSQGVFHALSIFESAVEVQPDVSAHAATRTKLLDYLQRRIAAAKFDSNTLYASELLSILLNAGGADVRKAVGARDLFKTLKLVLSRYRTTDPGGADETEFVENLFSSLCFALTDAPDNQIAWDRCGGTKLALSMVKAKRHCRSPALKVIDYTLTKCRETCESFVDDSGLKTLFACVMGRGKAAARKYRAEESADDEHAVSAVAQLFLHLSDVRYERLLQKFRENDSEKVERLIELHEKYYKRLEDAERKFQADRKARAAAGEEEDDADEPESVYVRRVDSGLFHLQQIDFVVAFVATAGDAKLRERVVQLLHQQDSSLGVVKAVLTEWSAMMTTPDAPAAPAAPVPAAPANASAAAAGAAATPATPAAAAAASANGSSASLAAAEEAQRRVKGVVDAIAALL